MQDLTPCTVAAALLSVAACVQRSPAPAPAGAAMTAFNTVWNVPYHQRPGFAPGLARSFGLLVTLGIIAEYIGTSVKMAMGRPLYLVTSDPADSPLGRRLPEPGG